MAEPAPDAPLPTYPGAPESLIDTWNVRRRALSFAAGEALPPLDTDLKALLAEKVPKDEILRIPASGHATKRHEIRRELAGFTELAALNCLLIAHPAQEAVSPPRPAPLSPHLARGT